MENLNGIPVLLHIWWIINFLFPGRLSSDVLYFVSLSLLFRYEHSQTMEDCQLWRQRCPSKKNSDKPPFSKDPTFEIYTSVETSFFDRYNFDQAQNE